MFGFCALCREIDIGIDHAMRRFLRRADFVDTQAQRIHHMRRRAFIEMGPQHPVTPVQNAQAL